MCIISTPRRTQNAGTLQVVVIDGGYSYSGFRVITPVDQLINYCMTYLQLIAMTVIYPTQVGVNMGLCRCSYQYRWFPTGRSPILFTWGYTVGLGDRRICLFLVFLPLPYTGLFKWKMVHSITRSIPIVIWPVVQTVHWNPVKGAQIYNTIYHLQLTEVNI